MKKRMTERFLALILVLALCLGMVFPAMASQSGEQWRVTRVDNSQVTAGNSLEALEEETAPYADTDPVRVSIVLTGKPGLETAATASQLGACSDAIKAGQEALAATISREILGARSWMWSGI